MTTEIHAENKHDAASHIRGGHGMSVDRAYGPETHEALVNALGGSGPSGMVSCPENRADGITPPVADSRP